MLSHKIPPLRLSALGGWKLNPNTPKKNHRNGCTSGRREPVPRRTQRSKTKEQDDRKGEGVTGGNVVWKGSLGGGRRAQGVPTSRERRRGGTVGA